MKQILIAAIVLLALPAEAKIHRSREVTRVFQREHPCPSTGLGYGPCRGWIKDHITALCDGGADAVGNMQWQTIQAAKAKDRTECKRK